MADKPDKIKLNKHRDLDGRGWHIWVRRGLLGLVAVPLVLALLNLFGQRPATSRAATSAATLSVYSPSHLRSGLLFTTRFHVTAHRDLKQATLVLDPGWVEDMQVNSLSPQPVSEGSRDGKLVFVLGHLAAGHSYIFFIEFQVNPTNVGHRSQNVELDDGSQELLKVHRTVTVYP